MHSLSGNNLQPWGAKHVADAMATNTTLKELTYALSHTAQTPGSVTELRLTQLEYALTVCCHAVKTL